MLLRASSLCSGRALVVGWSMEDQELLSLITTLLFCFRFKENERDDYIDTIAACVMEAGEILSECTKYDLNRDKYERSHQDDDTVSAVSAPTTSADSPH